MYRRAIYTLDMTISLILFITVLLLALSYISRIHTTSDSTMMDADKIVSILDSEGTPPYWNASLVVFPGLLTNNSLDKNKFLMITTIDYSKLKSLLGVTNDFFFYIHNSTGIKINNTCGYGAKELMPYNCSPLSKILIMEAKNIARRDITIAMPPQIVYLTVFVWES